MPDPNSIASLYPQPVNPASAVPSLLQNPSALLDFASRAQDYRSRQAVGNVFQNAIGPDGSFDTSAALLGIKNNPNAAWGAPDAISHGLALQGSALANRGQDIDNSTRALNLGVANQDAVYKILTPYLGQDSLSNEDQYNIKAKLAAAGINPATVAAADLTSPFRMMKEITLGAKSGAGAANIIQPTNSAPAPVTGAPTAVPLAATVGANGPRIVGNPPGFSEAATVTASGGAGQGLTLGQAADSSPTRKAMLGNLETDLQNFTSGPGADWTKVAKAWANRNVLPSGMQFDPTSIASQEQFTKQAEQLAQQQFAAIGGTGTDAKFGSAFKSNPNDTLSQLGNTGIIRLLKGNEDAIQAKNQAWQDWLAQGHSPATYPQFARQFNQNFDPRVYQSQYMSQADFRKMVKTMSSTERDAFLAKLKHAKDSGYATDPGVQYNGQ